MFRPGIIRALLLGWMCLGFVQCSLDDLAQINPEAEEVLEQVEMFTLLVQIAQLNQALNRPHCEVDNAYVKSSDGSAQAGSLSSGQSQYFYYTASSSATRTFTLTVSSGDLDLYVYSERSGNQDAAGHVVEATSLKAGTTTDSLALAMTSGYYRCVRVQAVSGGSYSFSVL